MKKLAAVAAVLFAVTACGGGGSSDSPANPARRACQLIDAAGETPGTRERQHSQYIAQAADLLRQSHVEGARQVAAQLDELNRRPVDVSDRVDAWDTGAEWCLAHDLPGDPQATATPTTTPAPPTAAPPPPTNPPTMSLAEFEAIQTGWSLQMVIDAVGGPGQQLSHFELSGYVSDIYMWSGEGGLGANANVQLQNGRVIGKSQFGLR